jgi:hypothetical protein
LIFVFLILKRAERQKHAVLVCTFLEVDIRDICEDEERRKEGGGRGVLYTVGRTEIP